MANGIKIGNLDISAFKVGDSDCKVYLGDTLLYEPTPPGFQGKWLATYTGGTTTSAECGASSAITSGEITKTNLVSVEVGQCVTSIGDMAFEMCSRLTSCTIGNNVTSIGDSAFYQCSSLTSIEIPDSVTSIVDFAFYSCINLTSVTCLATTPPTIGFDVFGNTNNCPIYVPSQSVNAYKTANEWSSYASRIQAIPTPTTLQWVTFNGGDSIYDINIYGIKGTVSEIAKTFNVYGGDTITVNGMDCGFVPGRYCLEIGGGCYAEEVSGSDNIELIFSNIGCSDYYTGFSSIGYDSGPIQLYIYA